jgi:hypothetical protein
MNVACDMLLRFYIFKGERLQDDYIQFCKPRTYTTMQKKTLDDLISFQKVFVFF